MKDLTNQNTEDILVCCIPCLYQMSHDVRKPDFCICENKDADQLRGNREADLRLCFRICKNPVF